MKFGVNILNFGPGANPEALLKWAKTSEALGYHSVMISDHVAITPSILPRYPEPFYDTFTTLAWLAGQTSSMGLGTTVVVLPYRHPVLIARLVANIDKLSGGRFIFGVGVGNAQDEFEVLDQPHAHRGAVGNECLRALKVLWTGHEPVSFEGRYVKFTDVSPIETEQKPHPPIWVGGSSEAAFRRTVRYGDAWHPILWRNLTLDWAKKEGLPALQRTAEAEGKTTPTFCPRIRLDIRDQPIDGERLPGVGSLDQVRADLAQLEKLGAEHVTLDWYTGDLEATRDHEHGWRMLMLLAEKAIDLKQESLR